MELNPSSEAASHSATQEFPNTMTFSQQCSVDLAENKIKVVIACILNEIVI
jgi:hypothetical protein